jgi:CheY-like chemotaxis protein
MPIVLVVDDDAFVRKAVRRELASVGFDCIEAGGGTEATALMQTNACAAVLLDYQMPDGLGDHVLAELRKLEPHIPVVMFSSQVADPVIAARLVALGATCLCEKPSVHDAVAAVVAACRTGDGT